MFWFSITLCVSYLEACVTCKPPESTITIILKVKDVLSEVLLDGVERIFTFLRRIEISFIECAGKKISIFHEGVARVKICTR